LKRIKATGWSSFFRGLSPIILPPHEHIDNPIKNWKNLLEDPEFVKDPRGWERREALKVLDELRSAKKVD